MKDALTHLFKVLVHKTQHAEPRQPRFPGVAQVIAQSLVLWDALLQVCCSVHLSNCVVHQKGMLGVPSWLQAPWQSLSSAVAV